MSESKKPRSADLKAIPGHRNYYVAPSGKIYYKDPKVPKFSTGETSITKAKRAVDIRRAQLFEGKTLTTAKRSVMKISNPLISDLWFEMLEDRKTEIAPSTLKTWQRSYKTGWGEYFENKHVQDLTIQNLNAFKKWYLKNKSTRHAEKMVIHMKAFFKWLKKNKLIHTEIDSEVLDNLHELIEKGVKRQKKGRIYNEVSEVVPMIAAAKELGPTAHLVVLMGIRYGMRIMEILKLTWDNVDLPKKTLKAWSDKNAKWRKIPLMDEIVEAFKAQREVAGKSKYVFPMKTNPNMHIYAQIFDKDWHEIKKTAGITGVARFHDMRHTFATRTAEDNWWTPAGACEMLDMSLATYMKVYVKISYEAKSEMMLKTYDKLKKEGGK